VEKCGPAKKTALRNQNCVRKEIKRGLNCGNAYQNLVRNLRPYRLLFKNVKIRMHVIIILPVVLCGLKLGLSRKELRLRVFENRVLRRISGPK